MVLNKRGITFLYSLMLGLCIIILGIALASPTKEIINQYMNDATCSSPANDFTQGLCWLMDGFKPLIIGAFIFIGLAVLVAKNLGG